MRNFLIIAALSLITSSSAYAGWWRTYGGLGDEAGYCVEQTNDGGYIVTGSPWTLLKLDERGNTQWKKEYGFGGNCVHQTSDGGYIVGGGIRVLKTNESGDTVWTNPLDWMAYWVEQTSDSGYIIVGTKIESGISCSSIRLRKISSKGAIRWERILWGITEQYLDMGWFVQETSDRGFILAVYLDGPPWYESLIKTDAMGNEIWSKSCFYNAGFNGGNFCSTRETSDKGFIMAVHDMLAKTDSTGDTVWTRYYEGDLRIVEQTKDGGYIVVGHYPKWSEKGELWILKTDSLGDTIWSRTYGGELDDRGYSLQETADGGYIIVGSTKSFGAGGSDIYLIKTDSLGLLGVSEPPPVTPITPVTHLEILSPIGPSITMRYSNCQGGFRAFVYDAGGRRVDKIESPGESGILAWGACYGPGVYFIRVESETSPFTVKVVLVR